MKLPVFLLLLTMPMSALALTTNSRPRKVHGPLKTMRGEVSPLRYQDSMRDREYMSDSAWKEATKSLQIRQFELQTELPGQQPIQQDHSHHHEHSNSSSSFKSISVEWEEKKTRRIAPPSEHTLLMLGSLLAVNAGFLNGLALSGLLGGTKMSVAAVTGAWTNSAVGLVSGNLSLFVAQFSAVLSYTAGSFLNGLVHPEGLDWTTNSKKRCDSRTLLGVASLVLAAGTVSSLPLLAMAIGMQTSWTSMLLPGSLLRSGHMSGITSDSGTKLGQMIRVGRKGIPADQMRKFVLQARMLGSFVVGGALSVVCNSVFGGGGNTQVGFMASATLLIASFAALNLRHINFKDSFRSKRRPWMLPATLL